MKVENGKSEFKEITNLCEISSSKVISNLLTMNTREDIIWELIDRVSNALFGSIIKQYSENRLKRQNDVNFRTELAVVGKKKSIK